MRAHLPDGTRIVISGYSQTGELNSRWKIFDMDATVYDIRGGHRSILKKFAELQKEQYEYLILDSWHVDSILKGVRHESLYQDLVTRYDAFIKDLEQGGRLKVVFPSAKKGMPFTFENVGFPSEYLAQTTALGPEIRIYRIQPELPETALARGK